MERLLAELKKNKKVLGYIVLFVVAFLFIAIFIPPWISSVFLSNNIEESKDIRSFLLKAGGGIIALVALYLNYRRTNATEDKNKIENDKLIQETERSKKEYILQQYSKAAELFASVNLSSKLSGIYLFEKIMYEDNSYYEPIIELLCAYIREKRKYDLCDIEKVNNEKGVTYNIKKSIDTEDDVQAILGILSNRNNIKDKQSSIKLLNLSGIHLRRISFQNYNFEGIDFNGTIFERCIFNDNEIKDCEIKNTYFIKCNINNTVFSKNKLNNVIYQSSNLYKVEFQSCFFSNTKFTLSRINEIKFLNLRYLSSTWGLFQNCTIILKNIMEADSLKNIVFDSKFESEILASDPELYKQLVMENIIYKIENMIIKPW